MANPLTVGNTILAFAVAIALIIVGILIAGVIDTVTGDIFGQLNVSSTWLNLRSTAVSYTQTSMNISLVGLILMGIGILLAAVFAFAGSAGRRAE